MPNKKPQDRELQGEEPQEIPDEQEDQENETQPQEEVPENEENGEGESGEEEDGEEEDGEESGEGSVEESDDSGDPDDSDDPEGEDAPEDHPAYRIRSVIEEIGIQQKRLANRNPRDLKSELKNNIYPMMEIAFEAIAEFIEYVDSPDYEEEIAQEVLMDAVEETRGIASKILKIILSIDVIKEDVMNDIVKVKKWAKDYLEKTEELIEQDGE